ncbi:MAG: glutathione synthase, partial [Myxococcota bacterium]|nr:glutathione synthase [Myxococcota bacterium]
MAFVMDPIERIDVRADTTFVLMREALRRGHRVFYVDPRDLGVDEGRVVARVTPVEALRAEPGGRHASLGEPHRVVLDDAVDVVWQRTDPPVDVEYATATQILALCR